METTELYLKTLFCCIACDGEIADEEVSLIKALSLNDVAFEHLNVENILNGYIEQINHEGKIFLNKYLNDLNEANLSQDEQLKIIEFAIKMIEADNQILYSEVRFFKKLRSKLNITDDEILKKHPQFEDYLLPDITSENKDLEDVGNFKLISFTFN